MSQHFFNINDYFTQSTKSLSKAQRTHAFVKSKLLKWRRLQEQEKLYSIVRAGQTVL